MAIRLGLDFDEIKEEHAASHGAFFVPAGLSQ